MQVETFECSETAAEPIEATEEAIALMESMGMQGQLELIRPKGDKPAARCCYREITAEEFFVYKLLCPTETKLSQYSASPIPLRVLQVAAHAKSLELFRELYVWDRESVTVKDPVLIASTGANDWDWQQKRYILARWGEELETFSTLLKRALAAKREQLSEGLKQAVGVIAAAELKIASLTNEEILQAGAAAEYRLTGPGL